MTQCKAEYHSDDGKDSLPFSSHTLICQLDEGHENMHQFYGGHYAEFDAREICDCPRCNPTSKGRNES